jgi:hypothetical protein
MGHVGLLIRFNTAPGAQERLCDWLCKEILPRLSKQQGLGSVHLLEAALAPQMTSEQRIRGVDVRVDWALLATGYSQDVLAALAHTDLGILQFEAHGAVGVVCATYRMDYTLTAGEVGA